jgi:CBS domain-containing protein
MKVRDLMTSDVKACLPEMNLAEAVKEMWDGDCGALPVVNNEGRVTGVITDRDICIAVATRGGPADRDVAPDHVHTCLPDDDAAAALQTMKQHRIRRLPVIDTEGHLRGMLSLSDIVTRAGAAAPKEVVATMASICAPRRPGVIAGAA